MRPSELPANAQDFRRACRARGLSPRTVSDYVTAVRNLTEWFDGKPDEEINTGDLQDYIADLLDRKVNCHKSRHINPSGRKVSPKYALRQYSDLQQFFRWAVDERLCRKDIWLGMRRPKVPKAPVPIITDADIATLIAYLTDAKPDGSLNRFLLVRDLAFVRFFLDTGVRVGDIVTMNVDSLDLDHDYATVIGKGSKPRQVPFGNKTGLALSRYLRVRQTRPQASAREFWIGRQGPLTTQGIREMFERRCKEAGIAHINPHKFRHTAAHKWLAAGLSENGLSKVMGWESPQMLAVYAASAATERAIAEHHRAGLGDRF